jgi:hypothetical protein
MNNWRLIVDWDVLARAESQAEDDIAEQLGVGGAAEDAELDRLKDCAEADILARANLVGRFAPLVAEFCVRRYHNMSQKMLQSPGLLLQEPFFVEVHKRRCESGDVYYRDSSLSTS